MVRILRDVDCPSCGWPETVAVGPSWEAGPETVECGRREPCGWSAPLVRKPRRAGTGKPKSAS